MVRLHRFKMLWPGGARTVMRTYLGGLGAGSKVRLRSQRRLESSHLSQSAGNVWGVTGCVSRQVSVCGASRPVSPPQHHHHHHQERELQPWNMAVDHRPHGISVNLPFLLVVLLFSLSRSAPFRNLANPQSLPTKSPTCPFGSHHHQQRELQFPVLPVLSFSFWTFFTRTACKHV